MKKIFFFILLLITSGNVIKAQNLIAVQHGSNTLFYTNLDSAIFNAQNGDTIYIPGGYWSINNSINKEIHILGVGHNPDSTQATSFTNITGSIHLINGSSNSSIEGLHWSIYGDGITFGNGSPQNISGVTIRRCYLTGIGFSTDNSQIHYQNIFIKENVLFGWSGYINGGYGIDVQNCIVSNNIISSNGGDNIIGINNSIIANNYIYGGTNFALANLHGCNISNNIFVNTSSTYIDNCVFMNNLCIGTAFSISGNNNFINNIESQAFNTTFVNVPIGPFSYTYNYHIQTTSPGHNGGKDGTDIGIYGGLYPWKEGSVPINPHIINSNIGGTTNPNGALPVNIKVGAQDH